MHLKICEDLSRQYGLGLQIPTPAELKKLARTGVRISPMKNFFMAVGFGEQDAERADAYYRAHFMEKYAPAPFPGVEELVRSLREAGLVLGIVTANVRANIEKALGETWGLFDPKLHYTYDHIQGFTKARALEDGVRVLGMTPGDVIFVGDQLADCDAARQAGVEFVGVSYGWGIAREDTASDVVRNIKELELYLQRWRTQVTTI